MAKKQRARDNFPESIKKKIAQSAMYVCSNPHCLRMTGYSTTEGRARSIAEAAHILPAGNAGPRIEELSNTRDTMSEKNGIWLCSICHKKIDDDPKFYTVETLHKWKDNHEVVIRKIVGKDLESALLDLRNHKNYHDETRELLSFLDNKRILYEGMDHEFPPRVLESLYLIRERVSQTRAKVNPDSKVFFALNKIQQEIDNFLRNIGPETDLKTLRCDSKDPNWNRFAEELQKLRSGIIIIMKVVAGDADYRLSWAGA